MEGGGGRDERSVEVLSRATQEGLCNERVCVLGGGGYVCVYVCVVCLYTNTHSPATQEGL